jgi:ABC-type dipeptide/oligopeptide/nickel transport system permease subunit
MAPVLACGVLSLVLWDSGAEQWLPPSISHPLGTDEFGRDILAGVVAAAGLSLAKGLGITAVAMVFAVFVSEIITAGGRRRFAGAARLAASVIESVPVVLWVMIVLIVIREPRLIVVTAAFVLAVLPSAVNILSGELLRLRGLPFVEAAYSLGVGEFRVLVRYLLPNAAAVLLPFALQVLGAAIAVDGAIGVIGLGNRSDLDLGIFLLRGKENFVLHPQVLFAALAMYALIYGYLLAIGRLAGRPSEDSEP